MSWSAPANSGTGPIQSYTVTSVPPGGSATVPFGTNSTTVSGLQNGGSYSFQVVATSAYGDSAPGTSNTVTLPDLAGAPQNFTVTIGFGTATLGWDDPASTGGSPVTGFVASASDGTTTLSSTSASPTGLNPPQAQYQVVLDGLVDGASYTFRVHAVTSAGDGADATQQGTLPCVSVGLPGRPSIQKTSGANGNQNFQTIFAGDFDNDGKADVLAVPYWTDLDLFHGQGDLTFSRAALSPAQGRDDFALTGDFNGDGVLDAFASANTAAAVYLGPGDGGFAPVATAPGALAAPASSGATADLDGDGHLDVVIAAGNEYVVYLGAGDGTFPQQSGVPVAGFSEVTALAVADLSGDGIPDLVVASHPESQVKVLPGNGDGTFGAPLASFSVQQGPVVVALADMNGDPHPDLVIAGDSVDVQIWPGQAGGTFGSPTTAPVGTQVRALAIADVNHDGKLDVLAGGNARVPVNLGLYAENAQLEVLLGNGAGNLAAPLLVPVGHVAGDPYTGHFPRQALAVADFDGDSNPDVAVATLGTGFFVFRGRGDGTFVAPALLEPAHDIADAELVSTPGGPVVLALGYDPVNPPVPNFAVAFAPQANGTWGTPRATHLGNGATNASWQTLAAGDLNGDGLPDLALAEGYNVGVDIELGLADGGFAPGPRLTTTQNAQLAVLCDLNQDGKLDVVVSATSAGPPGTLYAFPGQGDGGFGPSSSALQNQVMGNGLACADVNHDGNPDLVLVGTYGDGKLHVALGNGDLTFQPEQTYPLGSNGVQARPLVVDVNHDGSPDVVVDLGSAVATFLGTGTGAFGSVQLSGIPGGINSGGNYLYSPRSAVADLDGDGNLDVLLPRPVGVLALFGAGDGTFRNALLYPAADALQIVNVLAGDLNGDGRPDAVAIGVGNNVSSPLNLMLNTDLAACY